VSLNPKLNAVSLCALLRVLLKNAAFA
jgi:hypothetical protein